LIYIDFIFGSFPKLRKTIIAVFMSVRLSVCMEQLDSYWTGFHEILYFRVFGKSVQKLQA